MARMFYSYIQHIVALGKYHFASCIMTRQEARKTTGSLKLQGEDLCFPSGVVISLKKDSLLSAMFWFGLVFLFHFVLFVCFFVF